jgi:hypothetical protein
MRRVGTGPIPGGRPTSERVGFPLDASGREPIRFPPASSPVGVPCYTVFPATRADAWKKGGQNPKQPGPSRPSPVLINRRTALAAGLGCLGAALRGAEQNWLKKDLDPKEALGIGRASATRAYKVVQAGKAMRRR